MRNRETKNNTSSLRYHRAFKYFAVEVCSLSQDVLICASICDFEIGRVKMNRVTGLIIALICSFGLMGSAFADTSKIGVVDLQKIMQTSSQMKVIQQKLEKEFKPRRDKLVAMEESLKKDMETFKRDSTIMSQTQKKDLEKKIVSAQQTFEREGQQYQQELSTAHNEAMEELYGKIRKAIAKVAETEKYDLIMQKDATPYSIAALDITDRVMKEIN